jgi:hypothetical protein
MSYQVHDVGKGRRHPPSPLIVKLSESLRASSERIGGRRIFNSPALLQHQRAQPTILALIVLV